MWSDESGNGLGLDVTMKEAYDGGVGDPGLTLATPSSVATPLKQHLHLAAHLTLI